jgi:hypothetical protein
MTQRGSDKSAYAYRNEVVDDLRWLYPNLN